MKRFRTLFLCLSVIAAVLPVAAQEQRVLDYRRGTVHRDRTPEVSRQKLPDELVYQPGEGRVAVTRRDDNKDGRVVVPNRAGGREAQIESQAADAAAWAARNLAREFGYREYYRVGFHRAIHYALKTPHLTDWDFREGRREGRRDRYAEQDGADLGNRRARETAERLAQEDAADQFRNLNWRPAPTPVRTRIETPRFDENLDLFIKPELEDVFKTYPLNRFNAWRGREIRFYEDWKPRPWKIYNAANYDKHFDGRWRDPAHAFNVWKKDQRRGRFYQSLNQNERARFRGVFNEIFPDEIAAQYQKYLAPAYNLGWDDGLAYGLHVGYEWAWRRGYYEGVKDAAAAAAEDSFYRGYSRYYRRAYNAAYDDWSRNVHAEITDLEVVDGNDDGVFEPGESFTIGFRLTNYGGIGAELTTRLGGPGLENIAGGKLDVAARSSERYSHVVKATLSSGIKTKRDHAFTLQAGPAGTAFNLHVTYPLQFLAETRIVERDNPGGYASLEVGLENISTKPVTNIVFYHELQRIEIPRLAPGQTIRKRVESTGMRTLDLIGGRASLEFLVSAGDREQDRMTFTFPEVATDLSNTDLTESLLELARQPNPSRVDVDYAYRLLVRRMRADWKAAIKARGNPYKKDRKNKDTQTALGQLVVAYRAEQGSFANDEVFNGIRRMMLNMAKDLPGMHPFLRKQFKKLAQEIK
ncbi:MAG: hypothetical protein QNK37_12225 [Acidobacteriota bacterium]|nr:hypothetical protein [Acidobacteriota bacterium]